MGVTCCRAKTEIPGQLPANELELENGTSDLNLRRVVCSGFVALAPVLLNDLPAAASPSYWTDWTGSFVGHGTITTPASTVNVTYTNPQGIRFYQASGGTDWWTDSTRVVRDPATSPYTSSLVDNTPTYTDIVTLQFSGSQTLSFSQAIANPVFSYVSVNGNGYAFLDQDSGTGEMEAVSATRGMISVPLGALVFCTRLGQPPSQRPRRAGRRARK
jgi:hypothetical protein